MLILELEQNLDTQILLKYLPEGDHWPLAIGEGLHGFSQIVI